ncbi:MULTISPECIES: hypothetical protein [unclassified Streptomyces]|uniref:hypothetical protein n=1 Tax=unclassified Streptomyces TaxID=2593676 RepID=UPI000B4FFF91|nr:MULTISPECIES: hypothetical protein [unclassified Streptomyces]MYW99937.1 hypothetical protein [Streptomyces sp. SID8378]SNB89905.1 hypothetical protein SAMN02745831_06199 [Streptomyces sp. PgraA7]
MRVRLTDGTHEVDITTTPSEQATLDQVEAAALRLLTALRPPAPPPTPEDTPPPGRAPLGFTPAPDMDGVALTADAERSDQSERPGRYTEWGEHGT